MMTHDDRLFWTLAATFLALWLVDHWHIRMLRQHIRDLESGEATI
jgi:hypothetical protein